MSNPTFASPARLSNFRNTFCIARIPSQSPKGDGGYNGKKLHSRLWVLQVHHLGPPYLQRLVWHFEIVVVYRHVAGWNIESCYVACQMVPGNEERLGSIHQRKGVQAIVIDGLVERDSR